MPFIGVVSARFARRFSTESSRFRLAVSSGFVVAFVGVASIGFDRAGFADGLLDLFGSGFGQQQQVATETTRGRAYYGQAEPPRRHLRHHHREVADDAVRPHRSHRRHDERKLVNVRDDTGLQLGARSMCVRLCDGYAFPVGNYQGEGDRTSHEATCHSQCPGAETALYVMPSGSDSIGDAVRVGTGKNYSQLPDAFHYTSVLDSACTCHPAAGNRIKSILRDFTLRRGDAVMTQAGLKVFHGGAQFPYNRKDFVALAQSRDVTLATRATFKSIEKASVASSTTIAQRLATRPATVSNNLPRTRQFEHQASR